MDGQTNRQTKPFKVKDFHFFLDIIGAKSSSCPISWSPARSGQFSRLSGAAWEDQEGQDGRGAGGDEDQQLPAPPREEVSEELKLQSIGSIPIP